MGVKRLKLLPGASPWIQCSLSWPATTHAGHQRQTSIKRVSREYYSRNTLVISQTNVLEMTKQSHPLPGSQKPPGVMSQVAHTYPEPEWCCQELAALKAPDTSQNLAARRESAQDCCKVLLVWAVNMSWWFMCVGG